MTINVMDEYLELLKKYINKYIKLIFEYRYSKEICERYISKYIDVRYYDFYKEEVDQGLTLRKKVMHILRKESEKLGEIYPENVNNINNMCLFFYYIMYFDNVIYCKNKEKQIENIYKLRIKLLNKENEEIKTELNQLFTEWNNEKENFFEKFEDKEFNIKISNYKNSKNVYRINLEHKIKFPILFSEIVINKAFNTGLINEDKLYIEYYLTALKIIKDIVKQDFKKQYIVEFADSLLSKEKKIKGILNIIDNPVIQEKINLKIRYEKYMQYKNEIHELMRKGYKIAIIVDNSFEVNYTNLEKLDLFSYVLVSNTLYKYYEILDYDKIAGKIIEI